MHPPFRTLLAAAMTLLFSVVAPVTLATEQAAQTYNPSDTNMSSTPGKIEPYRARFGRLRPVIAIIGENSGTELTDFVIPFGVLVQSGVAETISVASRPGPLAMRPALHLQADATIAQFDAHYPDGADYVVVPAMVKRDDPAVLAWLVSQAAKGSTLVSICDGALVVANTGLLKGHRATAHWATRTLRAENYPDTTWVDNLRYVADGKFVSSAGISAAVPTSIALVEAIAGRDRAAVLASELGVTDWSTAHNSLAFQPRFGVNLMAYLHTNVSNARLHAMQQIGVPLHTGIDEIALAFTADAYSRTGRSQAYALATSAEPVLTRRGLTVIPDRLVADPALRGRILPAFDATPPALVLDWVLAAIAADYGRSTAYGVALDLEYPGFKP